VNGHCNKKRKEVYPWKPGASSGHTTNLKQSILRLLLSMLWPQRHLLCVPYSPSKLMQRLKKQLKTQRFDPVKVNTVCSLEMMTRRKE
jgi:hypothetical protein